MTEVLDYPIVTAPVLIPFTPDCEYQYGEDVLPPEKIKRLADSFQKYQIIDLQHEYTKRLINKMEPIKRGELLNSYISNDEMYLKGMDGYNRKYPKGTWVITVRITDPEAMMLYNNRQLTGFSVTVKERSHADAIMNYVSQKELLIPNAIVESEKAFTKTPKRILMKDVKDPVAFTVSLVRQPCVYGAKFCKKSCLVVNKDKLEENSKSNMSLKDKIKKELNAFIDGLDVEEESVKEDISESTETETIKEDGGGGEGGDTGNNGNGNSGGSGTGTGGETGGNGNGDNTETKTDSGSDEDADGDKGTSGGKVKKEAKKEDISEESEKGSSEKCSGGTKTIYGRKVKTSEAKKEENTESEADKEVLYLAQDDVENLISTTLRRYAEEIEQMVFDGIQEALDDYLFANDYAYKEDVEEEEEETEPDEGEVEEEVQKEYATPEMVQSIFDEQFSSFKSNIMENIKQAQKESIKSYSKAINQTDDGLKQETVKESFKPKVERDFNGCRIRKRK